jgi:Zn-dependent protease
MFSSSQGSIRLFRLAGIDVFLNWSWFLVAVFEINSRRGTYSSVVWNVLEYLALFLIVLIHEFGHALACRQVGGTANKIMLWPLGGVAYVDPPPRPGATLWSIAAGPLVNVALIPIFLLVISLGRSAGWVESAPDLYQLVVTVAQINYVLLVFNILPVYPLDGGQILRSLLWFVMGRHRSLMVATVVGLIGAGGFIILAVYRQSLWLGVISFYILMTCWSSFRQAQAMSAIANLPRRDGYICPTCKTAPAVGEFWKCGRCGQGLDIFQNHATCPHCGAQFASASCMECGADHSINEWSAAAVAPRNL